VVEVRHWSYPDYTRVVIELDRPVQIKSAVQRLPADVAAKRPERLYIELDGVWVGREYEGGLPVGDGLLEGVRIGQFTHKTIRVVLDLAQYKRHRVIALRDPHRLVLDVYGPRSGGELLRWADKVSPDAPRLPAGLRNIETVVIDPGHGGKDPGAVGVGGVREKDIALRLAQKLNTRLEARGFRVVLTRNDDRKITLEERTAIAEAARGDIFVSLHANASRKRSTSGVETYYLDENHERHSLNVAARENGVAPSAVNPLQRTLAKLRVSEVSPHSQRLAEQVQGQIIGGMPSRWRPMKDLGVKRGPFYVLFLSTMPAILVEAGFLTNKNDARRLGSDAYIGALADQIAVALDAYRSGEQTLAYQASP
jgi:N-acetylmuramoyl-L-alanine amidase